MKIMVLGGLGFVGSCLVERLADTDHELIVLSRRKGLDLTNINNVNSVLSGKKPDVIINLAAHVGSLHYVSTYCADVFTDNVQMSINLYKSVSKICPEVKIVNPLSNCSYPGDSKVQSEDEWWNGEVHDSVFSYGNAKKFLYVLSKCYHKQYGINSVNLLIPNMFGPGDTTDPNKTHAINGMIIRMLTAQKNNDSSFEIWGTGSPIREWIYVEDAVNILIQAIKEDEIIYPVNIAQNKGYSIKESAEYISRLIEFKGELIFNSDYQDGAPIKILDDKKFKSVFPNYVYYNHIDGLEETIKYYKSVL